MTRKITKEEFINFYHGTILSDIVRSYEAGAHMASAILSFCSLDYLASRERFKNHDKSDNGQSFRNIINGLFTETIPKIENQNLGARLYEIRNSLIHNYGANQQVKKSQFSVKISQCQFKKEHLKLEDRTIKIHLPRFIAQVIVTSYLFLTKLDFEDEETDRWANRFAKIEGSNSIVYIIGDTYLS